MMGNGRRNGWIGWLVGAFVVVASTGCAPDFGEATCETADDCFDDEVCVEGVCRVPVGGTTDTQTGEDGEDVTEGASVEIPPGTFEVGIDETIQVEAFVRDSEGEEVEAPELNWSSEDTEIATIEEAEEAGLALVTGGSSGTTTITAEYGDVSGSAEVEVSGEPENNPPIADAGDDQSVTVDTSVELNGSESFDPDMNDELTFAWSLADQPDGSSASIEDSSAEVTTMTPDVVGDFVVELEVDDGDATDTDSVTITAEPSGVDGDGGEVGVDGGDVAPDAPDAGPDADGEDLDAEDTVDDTADGTDTSTTDTSTTDTSATDTSTTDTSTTDTSTTDTSTTDTSTTDTSTSDTSTTDTSTSSSDVSDSSGETGT